MLRVGLTGGIACGKSVVLRELATAGLATIDLDRVARAVMAPGGAAHSRVIGAFGSRVVAPDGTIDRAVLGSIVFTDPDARARLNAIVHPEVRAAEALRLERLEREGCPVAVSDGAVLVEAGAHLRFDRLIVVHCPAATQLRRLVERDGITEAEARARVEAQMPVEEKRRYAHLEIDPARAVAALAGGASPGPRGIDAPALLGEVARGREIDLVSLCARLEPPAAGPWYRAGGVGGAPWPEALAAVPALWGLGRGADEEWQDAAAASLARLTHSADAAVAGACVAARILRHVVAGGSLGSAHEHLPGFARSAERWGGAPAPPRVEQALAAARETSDPAAARVRAAEMGAEPALAGALAGAAGGGGGGDRPPAIDALVAAVLGRHRRG